MNTSYCDAGVDNDDDDDNMMEQFGQRDGKLPDYRRSEILKHRSPHVGVWVTYKHGVYDITEYIEAHPGMYSNIPFTVDIIVVSFYSKYN